MNNQSHINESLGSIPAIIIGGNEYKKKRWKYIIIAVITLTGAFLCGILYTRWLTIPVKSHEFGIYSLKPTDSCDYKVTFDYMDNRSYYSYEARRRYYNDSTGYNTESTRILITNNIGHKAKETKKGETRTALQHDALYEELYKTTGLSYRNIDDCDHIFKIVHRSNETYKLKKDSRIDTNNIGDTISITGFNGKYLSGLGNYLYEEKSLIFTNGDAPYYNVSFDKTLTHKRSVLFRMLWKMEDISKAYYDVVFYSSYDSCVMNIDFVGDIRVHYINGGFLDTIKEESIGKISIKSSYGGSGHQFFLVTYTDLENIQTLRLFFLAAVFTVCFTTFLKTLFSYIWYEIENLATRRHRKKGMAMLLKGLLGKILSLLMKQNKASDVAPEVGQTIQKCKQCGAVITNDSVYCEFCGTMQTKRKTRWWAVVLIVLGAMLSLLGVVHLFGTCNNGGGAYKDSSRHAGSGKYVDLGLPSGTKWKAENEDGGFYTYGEAVSRFGDKLPTKEQMEELKDNCQWKWTGDGYKVTGPNGKSIVLPAAGCRGPNGSVHFVGSEGNYWSSTPNGSELAWSLYFYSGGVGMDDYYRCCGHSVRLVQD